MKGDSSRMIAEIRTAIEKGTLTYSEIERRLDAAIAAEIDKQDASADMELIRTCQSLLWELDTHGQIELADTTEQSLTVFMAKQAKKSVGAHRSVHISLRIAAAAAAVLLVAFGIGTLGHWEWLSGNSTEDEQQFLVAGNSIDAGTIAQGSADESAEPMQLETTDYDEAAASLGMNPPLPQWLPSGWALLTYHVARAPTSSYFSAYYSHPDHEYYLIYQIAYYTDAERAKIAFEQSRDGKQYSISSGNIVYIAQNQDDATCIWYDGLVCYNIVGPESDENILRIIENIKEME